MRRILFALLLLTAVVCIGAPAGASLIFTPNTYGLSTRSIGMGNAMTAVGDDYSMTYFNPGALGRLETSSFDVSYLFASPRLNGGPEGNEDAVDFKKDNKILLFGFTANLASLFNKEHGLGLGIQVAADNNSMTLFSFEESRDTNGQFVRYGETNIYVCLSLGAQIIPQLYIGAGGYMSVKGENTLIAKTDLAGKTKQEEIQVKAEPGIAPIVGIFAPVHPMVTIGAVYRGVGGAEFGPLDASTDALVSESSLTKLDLMLAFKDGYVPQQAALGVSVRPTEQLLLSVEGVWSNWSAYTEEIKKGDEVWSDAKLETKDLWIPRLGIEYSPLEMLHLRFGYYWEDTPFTDPGMGDTVVLDNARHVGSLGVAHDIGYIPFMRYPVTVGASYFYNYLQPRVVESGDEVEFESRGHIHGIIGSLTLRY